jgi:hypothetical protein
VSLWERTVIALREQHAYKNEAFFWTTLGIERTNEPLDTSVLHSWPSAIGCLASAEMGQLEIRS